jgi:NADPH2:quinone reductase
VKAIRVHETGGPEVLILEEVPDPTAGAGEVVVRVHAAGVNPVETYIRAGQHGYSANLPYTPGSDAAGVVEAVGAGVTDLAVGDRVYTNRALTGSYAERALVDAADAHALPEHVGFPAGAALGVPWATAYRGLFQRAKILPGETLLVHGATGGVGSAAVQLARAAGVTVIGTGGTEEGRRKVAELGAHHVLDHRTPDYLTKVRELTGGNGVDVILEMLANVNLVKDFDALARYGRIVVIGSRGAIELEPRLAMRLDASILGMSLPNTPPAELRRAHAAIGAGLENGSLRPLVGREFPLAEAARAHEAVMDAGAVGKIVLVA